MYTENERGKRELRDCATKVCHNLIIAIPLLSLSRNKGLATIRTSKYYFEYGSVTWSNTQLKHPKYGDEKKNDELNSSTTHKQRFFHRKFIFTLSEARQHNAFYRDVPIQKCVCVTLRLYFMHPKESSLFFHSHI